MSAHLSRWAWVGLLSAMLLAIGGIVAFTQTATLTISASPTSFNPSTGQTTTITYKNAVKATSVRIEVKNGSGTTVRTVASFSLLGAGTWSRVWDGKNSSGSIVPAGTYTVTFSGKDTGGTTLTPATASVTVVSTATPPPPSSDTGSLTVSASPTSFDPAAGQYTTITYKNTVKAYTVRIEVKNGSGTVVRTVASFSLLGAGTWSRTWDGKNSAGSIVPAGTYTVVFSGNDSTGKALTPATCAVTVAGATTPPPTYAFTINSITPGTIDPTQGQTTTISYAVPTTCDLRVFVKNSTGSEVRTLAQVSGAAAGTRTATWDGKTGSGSVVPNGTYTVTVESLSATPTITSASGTVTVSASTTTPPASDVLSVSASPTSFDPTAGQYTTITYKNTVKATSVRIDVKNGSGTVVRTVASFSLLGAGTWTRTWDGKNSAGSIVPAGTYTVEFSGKDESGATLTPATCSVTVAASTSTPTDPTPTDPTPTEPSDGTEKGQIVEGAGSSNWDWTKRAGYKMGISLRAPKSGTITQVMLQWKKSTGYGSGTYGKYNFELHTNGTGNFPSGNIIGRVTNVNPSTAMDGYLDGALRVPLTAQVTAGQIYHIVIYNVDSNYSTNWSSPNGLMTRVQPWDGTGNRTCYYSSGSWKPYSSTNNPWNTSGSNNVNGQYTATMLTWSDGTNTGYPYYSASLSGSARIYGSSRAGEYIYWDKPTTTISKVGVSVRKIGSPGALVYHLEKVGSGEIAKGTMNTSSMSSAYQNWVYATLPSAVTLAQGQAYRLWFESPTSSSSSNSYASNAIYGEARPATWSALSWGAGTRSYYIYGSSLSSTMPQADLSFSLQ